MKKELFTIALCNDDGSTEFVEVTGERLQLRGYEDFLFFMRMQDEELVISEQTTGRMITSIDIDVIKNIQSRRVMRRVIENKLREDGIDKNKLRAGIKKHCMVKHME